MTAKPSLSERWSRYVGDRDLETAIRLALDDAGYGGSLAEIREASLAGTVSPGWVQVTRFEVVAKHLESGEKRSVWGLAREDGRRRASTIRVYGSREERDADLREQTRDMINLDDRRGRRRGGIERGLLLLFLALAAIAVLSAILGTAS